MTTYAATRIRPRPASAGSNAPVLGELAPEPSTGDGIPVRDLAGHDVVEVWGHGSFPASDPPANW